jgi:predicted phage terminase large subunit-like protein
MNEWIAKNGSLFACTGRGGPLTGKGFRRVIVDDPFKNREEAESRLIRDRAYEWFTSTVLTRLEKDARGVDGSVFVVHTRWHEDDLIGRLLGEARKFQETNGEEGHPWEYVELQALDETTGEPLWPEKMSASDLRRRRAMIGEYDWWSLYQQKPRPRGARVFGPPHRCSSPEIDGARIVIGVDVAITRSSRANWTVAVVLAVRGYGADMRADIVQVVRLQEELPAVCRELKALQQTYQAPLVVEASGVGRAVPQTLLDTDPDLWVVGVEAVGDKFLRAQPVAAAWNAGRIRVRLHVDSATAEFLRVVCAFSGVGDKEDDDADALAHAWNHALSWVEPKGHAQGAGENVWGSTYDDRIGW